MKTIKNQFLFTEIGRVKGKILILHLIIFNNDISITVADIILKFCILVFHILPEGSVSHISFYLGPSFYSMQSYKKKFKNMNKRYPFSDIKL